MELTQVTVRIENLTQTGEPYELEYPYDFSRVSFMGSETVFQIVFGSENVEPILGGAALENTGIGIDPVSRTLERMAAKPLK